jgi:hypothetical protein
MGTDIAIAVELKCRDGQWRRYSCPTYDQVCWPVYLMLQGASCERGRSGIPDDATDSTVGSLQNYPSNRGWLMLSEFEQGDWDHVLAAADAVSGERDRALQFASWCGTLPMMDVRLVFAFDQ